MRLLCIFSVNGLRQVVKQFALFYRITVMILFRFIHKENIMSMLILSYSYQIGVFNRGFTVQIASNCRHFD